MTLPANMCMSFQERIARPDPFVKPFDESLHEHDVVCGRENWAFNHSGNKQFRVLIQTYREEYQTAKRRNEKARVVNEMIDIIKSRGGNFLKLDSEIDGAGWVAMSAAETYEKVSHALRSARELKKKVHRRRGHAKDDVLVPKKAKEERRSTWQEIFFDMSLVTQSPSVRRALDGDANDNFETESQRSGGSCSCTSLLNDNDNDDDLSSSPTDASRSLDVDDESSVAAELLEDLFPFITL